MKRLGANPPVYMPPVLPLRHAVKDIYSAPARCSVFYPNPILQVTVMGSVEQEGGLVYRMGVTDGERVIWAVIAPNLHWMIDTGHLKVYSTVKLTNYEKDDRSLKVYLAVYNLEVILPAGDKNEFKNAYDVLTLGEPVVVRAVTTDVARTTRLNQFITQDAPMEEGSSSTMISYDTRKAEAYDRKKWLYGEEPPQAGYEDENDDEAENEAEPVAAVTTTPEKTQAPPEINSRMRGPTLGGGERKIAKMKRKKFTAEEVLEIGRRKIAMMKEKRQDLQTHDTAITQESDKAQYFENPPPFWNEEVDNQRVMV